MARVMFRTGAVMWNDRVNKYIVALGPTDHRVDRKGSRLSSSKEKGLMAVLVIDARGDMHFGIEGTSPEALQGSYPSNWRLIHG